MNNMNLVFRCLVLATVAIAMCTVALAQELAPSPMPAYSDTRWSRDECTFRTQTPGGWGQDQCTNNNVACVRDAWFDSVFPAGLTLGGIDGGFWIHMTSSNAVAVFLPSGGTSGPLTQNYTDPVDPTEAGIFASHLMCAVLSTEFNDYPGIPFGGGDLGDQTILMGPFTGFTVDQVVAIGHLVIGGDLTALPAGRTISDLVAALTGINENFVDGTQNNGYLTLDCCEPPVIELPAAHPDSFYYGDGFEVCVTVRDDNNDVDTVRATLHFGDCMQTILATQSNDTTWCIFVPAACTEICFPGWIEFTAIDTCDSSDNESFTFYPILYEPEIACAAGNPVSVDYGQPITLCAVATDQDNNIASVTARYVVGGCDETVALTEVNGQYCVTVPGSCTLDCDDGYVIFTVTDECGGTDDITCNFTVINHEPVVACADPASGYWGDEIIVCATVTDPDNNVTGVTGRYVLGGCDQTIPASFSNGQWCITIPAGCTQTCDDGYVIFTATDACGLTDDVTCPVDMLNHPPEVACGAPASGDWGNPITVCATVTDLDDNVTGVTGRYVIGDCDQTIPASFSNGQWCITIPGSCTEDCDGGYVIFTATDACGATHEVTCPVTVDQDPPAITCDAGNPDEIAWNQPITLCVDVTDADNNVSSVVAHYVIGTCDVTETLTGTNGHYCITVPASCNSVCGPASVTFTVTDACGATDDVLCDYTVTGVPPVVECWTGNASEFVWGEPLEVCAIVSDLENNITSVTASYDLGDGCVFNAAATDMGNGRWCATIPGTCTDYCLPISVTFTATDACGLTDSDACTIAPPLHPPVVTCADPASGYWGDEIIVCATVTDPDNNVTGVTGRYVLGGCDQTIPAAFSNGQWCITIPAGCTQTCDDGYVIFTATDACGLTDDVNCPVDILDNPPAIACADGNPALVFWGDPITLCAVASDPDGNITSVTARYVLEGCDETVTLTEVNGQYCVTVPGSCTETCGEGLVTFTVTDACGLTETATCPFDVVNRDPQAACWDENPATFSYGEPLTVCAIVTDADGNLAGVSATYTLGTCTATLVATPMGGDRYCITIPAECTDECSTATVEFTGIDACDAVASATCTVEPSPEAPAIMCWEDNPSWVYSGDPITLCAVVSNAQGETVTATYNTGTCFETVPAVEVEPDRWCVTISGACTENTGTVDILFDLVDWCGQPAQVACNATVICPTDVVCVEDNPVNYNYGEAIEVCGNVLDPRGDVTLLQARYQIGDCDVWQNLSYTDEGEYCITVPANCMESCDDTLYVTFRIINNCGGIVDRICAIAPPVCVTPMVTCADDNPTHFEFGQGFEICAEAWVPGDCFALDSVVAHYTSVLCDLSLPATSAGNGRYCVTIPDSCTRALEPIEVRFTAYNGCDSAWVICTVEDTCMADSGRTQTQGGWGQDVCNGGNVACVRNAWFPVVFPAGVTIGGTYTIHFTSSAAVAAFLPTGGTSNVLTQSYTDPVAPTQAGVFAGQVLALQLSVAFGDYGVPSFSDLRPMMIAYGPFAGYTVDEIIVMANEVLGGNLDALPAGLTLGDLNTAVDMINNNFVDGTHDEGFLISDCCPSMAFWPDNPLQYEPGQALNFSAIVGNPYGRMYAMSGYYVTDQCGTVTFDPVEGPGDFWTISVPDNCTQNGGEVLAVFIVTHEDCETDTLTVAAYPFPALAGPSVTNLVIGIVNGQITLAWSDVPDAAEYRIFAGPLNAAPETMVEVGVVSAGVTKWTQPGTLDDMPVSRSYTVIAY